MLDASPSAPPRPAAVTASRLGIAAVGAYVGAQVIANVTSVKIGSTFGRAVDMGTFVYPITFTLRDVVHKSLGKRLARTVVLTAAGVNLLMAVYLQWAAGVRPDASYALDEEFNRALGDNASTLPWSGVWDVFLVNLTVKGAVSACSLPLIYLSPDRDWHDDPDDA